MTELEKAEFNKSYEKEFNEFFKDGYVKNGVPRLIELNR